MKITVSGKRSQYVEIYEQIKDAITNHLLSEGEKLPAIKDISEKNGLSYQAVSKAFLKLRKDGLIYKFSSKGFYVMPKDGNDVIYSECDILSR